MLLVSDVLLEWRDILKQVNDSLVVVPELNSLLPLRSLYHVLDSFRKEILQTFESQHDFKGNGHLSLHNFDQR